MNKHGKFISVEGIEGMGKSTAMEYLQSVLQAAHIPFVVTREPGGTPIAEQIREILLAQHEEFMHPDTELLLMFASRAQNISQVILPALQRGQWVVADRFTDASFAYQGGGRGIALTRIAELARWVHADLNPDVTLLLDAPVEIGLSRLVHRGVKDRIEHEGIEFFDRVRHRYLERAKKFPQRIKIIHADVDLEQVKQQMLAQINPMIEAYQACQA